MKSARNRRLAALRLKKTLSRLCLTMTLPWLILTAGCLCRGFLLPAAVAAALYMFAAPMLGKLIVSRLSRSRPQLNTAELENGEYLIAVAGSGFHEDSGRAPESWFDDCMIVRLGEAGRVAAGVLGRGIPCRICVSLPESQETREGKLLALREFFRRFGVPPESVDCLDTAPDSRTEVAAFAAMAGERTLILVSSCWHIPRLMMEAGDGGRVLAAPAGRFSGGLCFYPGLSILPLASGASLLEIGLHEIVGMLWVLCRKRFRR